ncbi:RHS repeat-associated core domain-containing protein [Pseudomonas xanthosomatis]|uniref:RHS repeat-associated core domain-containing protein n=1 Tax=Pseudomonas xanthosomatis TaxID=2842356 RepID=UPI001C3E5FEA|nr:RHS repeat-associated core domain-containing protein [Pseudomonas xanthosomatis]QXH46358.1 RHS repeat-associated core domain-containing protein [Pseudomonas xanthosomatis]
MASTQARTLRFYQGPYLALQLNAERCLAIVRHQHQPLALRGDRQGVVLGCDAQDSVLLSGQSNASSYGAFGYSTTTSESPLAYQGEWLEPDLEGYLLGRGYRLYSTRLMRFQSPDSLSPFGAGGLNAYAYCGGDPVNRSDPSGHMFKATSSRPTPTHQNSGSTTPNTRPAASATPQPGTPTSRTVQPAGTSNPSSSTPTSSQQAGRSSIRTYLDENNLHHTKLDKLGQNIRQAMKEGKLKLALKLNELFTELEAAKARDDNAMNALFSPNSTIKTATITESAPSSSNQDIRTSAK